LRIQRASSRGWGHKRPDNKLVSTTRRRTCSGWSVFSQADQQRHSLGDVHRPLSITSSEVPVHVSGPRYRPPTFSGDSPLNERARLRLLPPSFCKLRTFALRAVLGDTANCQPFPQADVISDVIANTSKPCRSPQIYGLTNVACNRYLEQSLETVMARHGNPALDEAYGRSIDCFRERQKLIGSGEQSINPSTACHRVVTMQNNHWTISIAHGHCNVYSGRILRRSLCHVRTTSPIARDSAK
jgi:hypothetical protein